MEEKNIKYNLEISKEGLPAISININSKKKQYLHSKFYPSKESEILKDRFKPDKYDTIIILGTGLGYHLIPLKEKLNQYKKIFLIDILKNLKEEISNNPKTGFLLSGRNIRFINGEDELTIEKILLDELNFDEIKGLEVIEHPQSMRVFPEYYTNIKEIIEKLINKKAGDKATKSAFGLLYLKNIIKNLSLISNCYPVSLFENIFNSFPCIAVTSGPSLEDNIQNIFNHQQKLFIIAVDTATPVLLKNKIIPDFVVSIDPQPYIIENFLDYDLNSIIPILSLSSHNSLYKKKSALVSLNTHPICQVIESAYPGKIGSVDSLTGTVAGDAVSTAGFFGFKATGLIGFDFSFNNFNIYARGTSYQKRFSKFFQNRMSSVETYNMNYIIKSSRGFKIQNKFSRKSFINYKELIEKMLIKLKPEKIYNINKTGLKLKGISEINFNDFINSYCSSKINKPEIIKKIFNDAPMIKNIISISDLKTFISDKFNINNILEASIDNKINNNIKNKILQLIANINTGDIK